MHRLFTKEGGGGRDTKEQHNQKRHKSKMNVSEIFIIPGRLLLENVPSTDIRTPLPVQFGQRFPFLREESKIALLPARGLISPPVWSLG